jgi:protease I
MTRRHCHPAVRSYSRPMGTLRGKSFLTIVDDLYEDLELWYPKYRFEEEGATVVIAGLEKKTYAGKNGYPCAAEARIAEVAARDFDGFLIPGGFMPDKLRRDSTVLQLTRDFDAAQKLIGMICHAGWIPISAKILRGRRVTSTPGIRDDLENAGAVWVDAPVVVDSHFVSARRPPDLPAYGAALIAWCHAKRAG